MFDRVAIPCEKHRNVFQLAMFLIAAFGIASLSYFGWVAMQFQGSAEQEAYDYLQLVGNASKGHTYGIAGRIPLVSASIPADRMTDYMAEQLVNIRNLESVGIFPPDPHHRFRFCELDLKRITKTQATLRELDAPISEKGIVLLEQKFPRRRVYVYRLSPSANGTPIPTARPGRNPLPVR